MKILVGLGNPGDKYVGTRHNAGVELVDAVFSFQFSVFNKFSSKSFQWHTEKGIEKARFDSILLVKSREYFMNESGKIIQALGTKQLGLDELYVAHDDLDLKLGEYKIQFGKGPSVHGGVNDIERVIGKDFWRIRIGVDNRGIPRIPGEEYVLQRFGEEEVDILSSVIAKIIDEFKGN